MGGCFSVSVSCDQVVDQASQWLCLKWSHIHNLAENLASLEKAMGVLKAKRDDVQRKVDREEYTGHHQRLSQVQVWLTSILATENQYNDVLSTSELELQRLYLCGFCSKNFKLSYTYGKRVALMLKEVESLSSRGEFEVVTEAAPIADVEELPIHQFTIVGQETMFERIWNRLMDDKVRIVGLYGMGGVGKTTLLTQINNKFLKVGGRFDVVIWVVVSKNASVRKIQGDIGKKLGLSGKEWDEKDEKERALDIHKILKTKKFVLLLDDIWEKVNLYMIGVSSIVNGSKVAFTTRSRDVCGRMEDVDPIEVRCLENDKAWDLFKRKVGENTLRCHPDIPELARKVAEKCRGLPLALNVIGETMSCKTTIQEWRRAIDVLTSYASEFSGMEDEILPILKYSYDDLKGEQVKWCFLYCSLFPEDSLMDKERLIEYWIGEGFIDENEGIERALNQGYEILGTIVRACLLLEDGDDKAKVKMHDVVRDMALWITSNLGRDKEKCIVRTGVKLSEIPKVKNWTNVRMMSLMDIDIEMISESHECPQLTTLLLRENKYLENILGEFFQSMPRLLVLDLSKNGNLRGLPEEISGLVSLRYLDLSYTNIKRLPVGGLQGLKMLIHLNLEWTSELESLQGISNLLSLRTLKLRYSKVWLNNSLITELHLLKHLEFVTVNTSPSFLVGGEPLLYDYTVGRYIQEVDIDDRQGDLEEAINLAGMENLRVVVIRYCKMEEIKIKIEKRGWNKSPSLFSKLSILRISNCNGLKDLTWLLLFAPNLTSLHVLDSRKIEEIISEEKAASVLKKGKGIVLPFQKLEELELTFLPELKSIYWTALPFQRLTRFSIVRCPKLRKLPLDSKSVANVEDLDINCYGKQWIERIEWVDKATQERFLPKFKGD